MEFIEGYEVEAQECGVRTHGNIGRRYAQKGLSLYARKEYGKKKFPALFDNPDLYCKHLVSSLSCATGQVMIRISTLTAPSWR